MKQANTAATYEKMVLSINEWMTEQGYEAFAEVVEVAPKRFELKLLIEADGSPRMPSVESIVDFLIGMSTGEVEKGGSRSARDKEWYASNLWGKSQAEICMPLAKKGKYGWGAHKDTPFRLGRIGQHLSALRHWLQEQLLQVDTKVANPTHDGWVDRCMEHLTQEVGNESSKFFSPDAKIVSVCVSQPGK